jgi:hypothetical protein
LLDSVLRDLPCPLPHQQLTKFAAVLGRSSKLPRVRQLLSTPESSLTNLEICELFELFESVLTDSWLSERSAAVYGLSVRYPFRQLSTPLADGHLVR